MKKMITDEMVRYTDINDVLDRFNNLTGWNDSREGLNNANWTSDMVYKVIFGRMNEDQEIYEGDHKYLRRIEFPEDAAFWRRATSPDNPDEIVQFGELKTFLDNQHESHTYLEIDLRIIIFWLMKRGELPVEDGFYHLEW